MLCSSPDLRQELTVQQQTKPVGGDLDNDIAAAVAAANTKQQRNGTNPTPLIIDSNKLSEQESQPPQSPRECNHTCLFSLAGRLSKPACHLELWACSKLCFCTSLIYLFTTWISGKTIFEMSYLSIKNESFANNLLLVHALSSLCNK